MPLLLFAHIGSTYLFRPQLTVVTAISRAFSQTKCGCASSGEKMEEAHSRTVEVEAGSCNDDSAPSSALSPTSVGGSHPSVLVQQKPRCSLTSLSSQTTAVSGAATEKHPAPSNAQVVMGALLGVLAQLDEVAEDRIRDAKTAKALLAALIRAVRSGQRERVDVPVQRVLDRLCYYANARDTGIRSATFRTIRYVVVDREAAARLCKSRLVLSVIRSLEREPKYLWERVQALKVTKTIMEVRGRARHCLLYTSGGLPL